MPNNTALLETTLAPPAAPPVSFLLNGKTVVCGSHQSILEAAQQNGVEIPRLCYMEGMRPDGNCRTCMVEIKGERVLAPSCCRYPKEGMEVTTNSARALTSQKMSIELLLADIPETSYTLNSELDLWAKKLSIGKPRFAARHQPIQDLSHPAMAVNLDACIQCKRCVRACREEQVNDVIGYAFRGGHSKIVFDLDDQMGDSTCVACGECVQACPTGALMPAREVGKIVADKQVDSVCPYCGVGCQLTYNIKDNIILYVQGKDGPANSSRLCVKGRYGFDYVQHKHRLTKPLIRKPGVPKTKDFTVDPENWRDVFREATWEEALDLAAKGFREARDTYGKRSLAGFGSAKCTNEEAYVFQKLVRTGFGSNNVDHCTRLCHASSVAALMEGINSGAVSNQVRDAANAEVIFLIGANPTVNHPVAATFIKNAAKAGVKLIVADPRRGDLARHATYNLQFKADTDVALLNAMLHVIVEEGLVDKKFVADRTSGYEALAENVKKFSPELMAPICGIDAQTIREVARLYATSKASIIFWGMGISQHVHGTDNARCLIALALSTGQIGKPGSGLHPLRGQNNVQGASDAGLIPMFYPDYQRVGTPAARQRFEKLWHMDLDPDPGLTVVETLHAAKKRDIRSMFVMGENPAMSDPDVDHAREALATLDHLVVQDIFLTETAYLADVVLAATAWPEKVGTVTNTDRMVQLGRKAIEPPVGHLSVRERRRSGRSGRVHRGFPDGIGTSQIRSRRPYLGGGTAGRRISHGAHHRAPTGALAHRSDDAPCVGARFHRAGAGCVGESARSRKAGRPARRHDHDRIAAWQDLSLRARRRWNSARYGVRPLLLLRGSGEYADQPGTRSSRQDSRVQILRGKDYQGRPSAGAYELRGRCPAAREAARARSIGAYGRKTS